MWSWLVGKWLQRCNQAVSEWSIQKFCRYTDRSRALMVVANRNAQRMGCAEISPDHMLLAMVGEAMETGVGKSVLLQRGIDLALLRTRLERPLVAEATSWKL